MSKARLMADLLDATGDVLAANLDNVTLEGSAVKSTGEAGATKFLREDGDNTSSWQIPTNTTYTASGVVSIDGSNVITSTGEANAANTAITSSAQAWTATQTLKGITETEATNSTTTYTVDLANGTIFDLTSASAVTITMPSAAAGKSFTIIVKTAPAWSGTILWASATVPSAATISIYSFISDGTSWYGMEAGNGFA
jgi:hypothetical protein